MDLFGNISAAVSLALAIKAFCDSITSSAGNDRLMVQIQHDAATLESFAEIFDKVKSRDDLRDKEKILLKDVCVAVHPLLERLERWIETKQQVQGKEVNLIVKWIDKFTSVLWKNADTRKLASELMAWTERYHIRLSLLPTNLREKLLQDVTGVNETLERYQTHMAIRSLRASFQDLSLDQRQRTVQVLNGALLAEASHSRVFGSYDQKRVVVEYKKYPETLAGASLEQLTVAVQRLVAILRQSDTHLCRILRCQGYVHQTRNKRYALVYELPFQADFGTRPTTLLDLIKTKRTGSQDLLPPQHPLNQRFELGRKIACAVLYVQAMGWVHKSIRTNNVIILEKRGSEGTNTTVRFPKALGNPYLCGFDMARQDKAASDQSGDAYWEFNIYRHPARQGLHPEERYSMNHDIYSLGVVLLELGIWKPLLALSGLKALKGAPNSQELVKEFFLKLASEALPIVMGQKYGDLVSFCLSIDGESPVSVSTAIDEVLFKLEEMSTGMH